MCSPGSFQHGLDEPSCTGRPSPAPRSARARSDPPRWPAPRPPARSRRAAAAPRPVQPGAPASTTACARPSRTTVPADSPARNASASSPRQVNSVPRPPSAPPGLHGSTPSLEAPGTDDNGHNAPQRMRVGARFPRRVAAAVQPLVVLGHNAFTSALTLACGRGISLDTAT